MALRHKAYLAIIILVVIYSYVSLILPADPHVLARYHISTSRAQVISAGIIVPFALIWWANVYGFVRLYEYAKLIKSNQDGQAFSQIANGLGILAFRMPIASTLSSLLAYLVRAHQVSFVPPTLVINYFNILMAMVGFSLICRGATKLLAITGKMPPLFNVMVQSASLAVLSLAYSYLALPEQARRLTVPGQSEPFYFSAWIMMTTIILPYLYVWHRGLAAAMNIYFYQRNVPGSVYRHALRLLSWGIGTILFATMLLQLLTSQSDRLNKLNLGPLIMLVYAILIIIGLSSVFVAIGAKKLKKIEEV